MPEFTLPSHEFNEIFERRFAANHDRVWEVCVPFGEAPAESGAYGIGRALAQAIRHKRDNLGIPRLEERYRKYRFNPLRRTSGLKILIAAHHETDTRLQKAERAAERVTSIEKAQRLIEEYDLKIEVSCLPDEIVFEGARLRVGDPLFYVTFWGADLPIIETLYVTGYRFDQMHFGKFLLTHEFRGQDGGTENWGSDKLAGLLDGTYRGHFSNKEPFLDEAAARAFAVKACQDWITALQENQEIFEGDAPLPSNMSIWRQK